MVGFGVIIRPIVLTVETCRTMSPSFDQEIWDLMTIPGNASYQSALGPIIIAEIIGNLVMIVTGLLMIVLYFRRKRIFPVVAVAYFIFGVVFGGLDAWAAGRFLAAAKADMAKQTAAIFQMAVMAAIWIPYMLRSHRVKATFTH